MDDVAIIKEIAFILRSSDLTVLSVKSVRRQLSQTFGEDTIKTNKAQVIKWIDSEVTTIRGEQQTVSPDPIEEVVSRADEPAIAAVTEQSASEEEEEGKTEEKKKKKKKKHKKERKDKDKKKKKKKEVSDDSTPKEEKQKRSKVGVKRKKTEDTRLSLLKKMASAVRCSIPKASAKSEEAIEALLTARGISCSSRDLTKERIQRAHELQECKHSLPKKNSFCFNSFFSS